MIGLSVRPTKIAGGRCRGAMKRSSDESDKPFSSSKKQSKPSEDECGDMMFAGGAVASGAGGTEPVPVANSSVVGQQSGMESSSLGSYQGVPHHLGAMGSIYLSRGRGTSDAPITVPSLLGNLPVHQQQQQRHHHHQPFQLPLTFGSQGTTGSDPLAQYLFAAQLAREIAGPGTQHASQEHLGLHGITSSMQQRQREPHLRFSLSNIFDQVVYYGRTTQQFSSQGDNTGGFNLTPRLASSVGGIIGGGGASGTAHPVSMSNTVASEPPSNVLASDMATPSTGVPLSLTTDRSNLSEYQCMIREQIDLFAATQTDIDSSAQGRNRPIVVGQVGIRCRHCASLPSSRRSRGAVYYPAKLSGLYQAAQNMTLNHFTTTCQSIPQTVRDEMIRLKQNKSYVLGGGKGYWARGGQIRNILEIDDRLFFRHKVPERFRLDFQQTATASTQGKYGN